MEDPGGEETAASKWVEAKPTSPVKGWLEFVTEAAEWERSQLLSCESFCTPPMKLNCSRAV
jgi:hypothetical protein